MVKAQEWLDKNYPDKERRKTIVYLGIHSRNLEGSLDLSDFVNLEELHCLFNQLTFLNISNCPRLTVLMCYNNQLTNLDLRNNKKLKDLYINNNNFAEQDLSFLNNSTDLERLFLANFEQSRITQNIYNRFSGSLKPLKDMNKLKWLGISNTDIDSGLEYLPESLEWVQCKSDLTGKRNWGAKKIEEQLKGYEDGNGNHDYQTWKKRACVYFIDKVGTKDKEISRLQNQLFAKDKKINSLQWKLTEIQTVITKLKDKLNNTQFKLSDTNFQLNETIDQLTNANNQLNAWQSSVFLPRFTLGQPDSWVTFRTQISPMNNALGAIGCYFLYKLYLKHKKKNLQEQRPTDSEQQPLLEVERLNQRIVDLENWKQKHSQDIKEKSARITELEEQLQTQPQAQILQPTSLPYGIPGSSQTGR